MDADILGVVVIEEISVEESDVTDNLLDGVNETASEMPSDGLAITETVEDAIDRSDVGPSVEEPDMDSPRDESAETVLPDAV